MDTRAQRFPQPLADRGSDGLVRSRDDTIAVLPKSGKVDPRRSPATASSDHAALHADAERHDSLTRASLDPMRTTDRYQLARPISGLLGDDLDG